MMARHGAKLVQRPWPGRETYQIILTMLFHTVGGGVLNSYEFRGERGE